MTDTPSPRRSRSRLAERTQHLYMARAEEYTEGLNPQSDAREEKYTPNEPNAVKWTYTPNEEMTYASGYTPNEEICPGYTPNEENCAGYTPNEDPYAAYDAYAPNETGEDASWPVMPDAPTTAPQLDFAAYYSREGATQEEGENAFAPPPSMQQFRDEPQIWQQEEEPEPIDYAAATVYRPREVTWAEEEREETLNDDGYQVEEEAAPVYQKRHTLRNVLIVLLMLVLLGGAAWLMREPLAEMLGVTVFWTTPTETPAAAVVTPEPVKAYDAAPAAAIAAPARNAIEKLSGALNMEYYIVTDHHIVTRNQRADGSYDFYLFTAADGRLLCYFEGLEQLDMIPQEFGGFYVKQAPWLVTAGGSALIRTSDIEAAIRESVFLHPMYQGWSIVESLEDGHANYVDAEGRVLSSLWFCRLFPFTGEYTLAYVDTGSTADADERYLLYVVGKDGSMSRWLAAGQTQDVTASVCGMAYMSDGALYQLPDVASPVCVSSEVTAYLDCDAMVVRDPQSGKYGLFVHGAQHYAFEYDSIHPLESDITWTEKTFSSADNRMTVKAVSGAAFPQPLSYSFVLEKEGRLEYVALSTQSSYPIRLDGEF